MYIHVYKQITGIFHCARPAPRCIHVMCAGMNVNNTLAYTHTHTLTLERIFEPLADMRLIT
jgi:hypothetical protein